MVEGKYKDNTSKYIVDKITRVIFLICAFIAVISLLLIIGFVFYKGLTPFIFKGYSFIDFHYRNRLVT